MCSFNAPLPEGSLKARIRCTAREMKTFKGGSLGDTLGDEPTGLVQIDFQGHPIRYDELGVYEEVIAESRAGCRLDLQVQTEGRTGWRNVSSLDLPAGQHSWREKLQRGAQQLREDTNVKASDAHYDAKLFPHVHPYGTGSLLAEFGSGAVQKHCRARALALQSWFRQSSLWCFWQLDLQSRRHCFSKMPRAVVWDVLRRMLLGTISRSITGPSCLVASPIRLLGGESKQKSSTVFVTARKLG